MVGVAVLVGWSGLVIILSTFECVARAIVASDADRPCVPKRNTLVVGSSDDVEDDRGNLAVFPGIAARLDDLMSRYFLIVGVIGSTKLRAY